MDVTVYWLYSTFDHAKHVAIEGMHPLGMLCARLAHLSRVEFVTAPSTILDSFLHVLYNSARILEQMTDPGQCR